MVWEQRVCVIFLCVENCSIDWLIKWLIDRFSGWLIVPDGVGAARVRDCDDYPHCGAGQDQVRPVLAPIDYWLI